MKISDKQVDNAKKYKTEMARALMNAIMQPLITAPSPRSSVHQALRGKNTECHSKKCLCL